MMSVNCCTFQLIGRRERVEIVGWSGVKAYLYKDCV